MSSDSQNLELGNYRVLKRDNGSLWELGKGSYGTTYKAEHIGLKRISALKVINDHLIRDDVAKQRFQQEAQAAASLDHAHIASIHDFGEVDGMFYYAMKYCSGGDLESFCTRRGPQQWPVVKSFALQIFGALKAAHDKGMLHRDLKPSNVMLADEKEPINLQLIDFGLVKALDHHNPSETALMATREGSFMGNPLTASPEQFREEDLDERSDLFSVGITLWYLLHGGSPFGNVAAAKIAHQRLSIESYDDMLPADLPADARAILNKLLAPDRDQRFRYAQEVIEALQSSDDSAVAEESVEPEVEEPPMDGIWEITSPIKQLPYGTYYGSYHKLNPATPPGTVFIPDEHSPYLETIHHHANQLVHTESLGLCNFFREGEIDGTKLYLCQALSNCTLQFLLQLVNRLSVHNDLALLKQVALAVDEAAANQLSGVEMEDNEIFLALDPSLGKAPLSADEWPAYIENEARREGGHTAGIVAIVLPRLVDDTGSQEASATIGGDDLASNPLARFAGFLYRVLSGMSAKQTAYLSTVNYVSFSDVSEESNQYLSHIIAGMETPESALSMLQQVCSNEGSHFDGAAATIQRSVAATNPLAAASPPPKSVAPPPLKQPIPPAPKETPKAAPNSSSPASASATVVPPSQIASPPSKPKQQPPKRKKKVKKKGSPVLKAFFALILLGALGAGGFFGWQHLKKNKKNTEEEFVYEGPVEGGVGEVHFTNVEFGKGAFSVDIRLKDANGMALGTDYQKTNSTIKISDFPTAIFKDSSRWPLSFSSVDPIVVLDNNRLKIDSFDGESLETKTYAKPVRIKARQTTTVATSLTMEGNEVGNGGRYLKFLRGKDRIFQWQFAPEGNRTRITLEEGQTFPIEAQLKIPFLKTIPLTIEAESTLSGNLSIQKRLIKFHGISSEHQLQFIPEYDKILDDPVRELIQTKYDSFSISGTELQQTNSEWELPSLEGLISVKYSNRLGEVTVSEATSTLVFVGEQNRLPKESNLMLETRKNGENGKLNEQVDFALQLLDSNSGEPEKLAKQLAFRWFSVAADREDIEAITAVGIAYLDGTGTNRDFDQSFSWLSKAAAKNHPESFGKLGKWYENENNPKRNIEKAKEYYIKASGMGNLQAKTDLAGLLLEHGSEDEMEKAIETIKPLADEEHPYSTYLLGYAYLLGKGVPREEGTGIRLLRKASALNSRNADDILKKIPQSIRNKYK